MKIKICGIQTKVSSTLCEDLNVDFIGLNFVPISKRFIGLKSAELKKCNIVANKFSRQKVGVFMDQEIDIILKVLKYVKLDVIQLHGQEDSKFIKILRNNLNDFEDQKYKKIKIWKAFSLKNNFDIKILKNYEKNIDLFLFDGGLAGSGEKIEDQGILQKSLNFCEETKIKYGIAGGINHQNISTFKKKFPNAFLLDTASGIEKNGVFNQDILKKLLKNFNIDISV